MTGLSDRSAFEAFDRMAERIEQNERLTLASAEVAEELGGDQLERQFQQLEVSDDAEARLLELKQKMGLLPTGSESASRRRLAPGEHPVRDADLHEAFEKLEKESGAGGETG